MSKRIMIGIIIGSALLLTIAISLVLVQKPVVAVDYMQVATDTKPVPTDTKPIPTDTKPIPTDTVPVHPTITKPTRDPNKTKPPFPILTLIHTWEPPIKTLIPPATPAVRPKPGGPGNLEYIAFIAVLVVLIVGVIGYSYINNRKKSPRDP